LFQIVLVEFSQSSLSLGDWRLTTCPRTALAAKPSARAHATARLSWLLLIDAFIFSLLEKLRFVPPCPDTHTDCKAKRVAALCAEWPPRVGATSHISGRKFIFALCLLAYGTGRVMAR